MSALAVSSLLPIQEVFPISEVPAEFPAIQPLLDLAILHTGFEAAYVYRLDLTPPDAALAAFSGPAPTVDAVQIAPLHRDRKTPIVLHAHAAADWRFAGFPEFRSGRFDGVVSVPLLDSGGVVGVANFCRAGLASLNAGAISFLMNLSLPLGALLAAAGVRRQLHAIQQDLADRKLIERAKGILQSRHQLTEEDAYLQIRRLSRRRRTPMREIAREVIFKSQFSTERIDRHETAR